MHFEWSSSTNSKVASVTYNCSCPKQKQSVLEEYKKSQNIKLFKHNDWGILLFVLQFRKTDNQKCMIACMKYPISAMFVIFVTYL